jgi:hypothetical protein
MRYVWHILRGGGGVSIINIFFQLNNNNVIVVPLPLYIYVIFFQN